MATQKFVYQSDLTLPTDPTANIFGYVRADSLSTGLTVNSVANDALTVTPNTQIPIRVASTRKYGIIARHIVLFRVTTTAPLNIIQLRRIVIFQPSIFIGYVSQLGASVAYDGLEDWKIIGANNERFRLFFTGS
jgi:hypothetical protein